MIPDKPFANLEEQIDIISSRNVLITKDLFTYESLSSISYYTLMNGYKNTFLAGDGDNFAEGTTFRMIYTCHWLDISLSNIILKYILLIEKSLKTKLSYVVSENFGVFHNQYLFYKNYSNPNNSRNGTLTDIREVLLYPKENTVTYYYKHNKNHIPSWILVNDLMFGLTIQWYTILKKDDKDLICSEFFKSTNLILSSDQQKELLKKSLYMVKDFRNKVAHGNRTLNLKLRFELPKTPLFLVLNDSILKESEYDNNFGKNDLYSVIIIIFILLNDTFQLNNFTVELKSLLDLYNKRNIDFNGKDIFGLFNLPKNLFERLEAMLKTK